jgi:hypothetical protein
MSVALGASRARPGGGVLALVLFICVALAAPLQAGTGPRIKDVRTRLDNGSYVMDADIAYRFSPEVLEALGNGVPLTFLVHIQVRRASAWIWEDSLADIQLRYGIRYRPLSERYEVYRLPGESGRSFVSREAAISALGEIRGLDLVSKARLDPNESYEVQMKVELDIEELPLPLRPLAYLQGAWKLATPWTKWPLAR